MPSESFKSNVQSPNGSSIPSPLGPDLIVQFHSEIASTWASAKALWTGYQARITNLREGQTGVSETRNLFVLHLFALLGYQPEKTEAETLNGKFYAISHRDISRDGLPLHIMGWHDSLDKNVPQVAPAFQLTRWFKNTLTSPSTSMASSQTAASSGCYEIPQTSSNSRFSNSISSGFLRKIYLRISLFFSGFYILPAYPDPATKPKSLS